MRILIVEDDVSFRNFIVRFFTESKHEIEIAINGKEGLKKFHSFSPDLVLSDIEMPEMTGLELLEQIRITNQDCIIVMMTGFEEWSYVTRAMELKANNYLKKPFTIKELNRIINKYSYMVEQKITVHELTDLFTHKSFKMSFENSVKTVGKVVDFLTNHSQSFLDSDRIFGLRFGFNEIIINALEHGNLGITYKEKTDALNKDICELEKLYNARIQDPVNSKKKIHISFEWEPKFCQWTISDEGDGFDWKNHLKPEQIIDVSQLHGRGIFLTKFQFDSFGYTNGGRTAILRINL